MVLRPHSRAARRTCTLVVWIQTSLSSRFEAARGTILPRELRKGTEAQRRSDSEPAEKSRENLRVREFT